MRKFSLIVIVIIFSIPLLGSTKAAVDGITLNDLSKQSLLYHSLNLRSEHHLGQIVILPDGNFDELAASGIISRLDKIPSSILTKVYLHGIQVKLFEGKLTDNPTAKHLTGVIPRGYQSKTTWDDVPGMGGSKTVLVKIGASEKGQGHGSVNLELHELAHSVDRYVYNEIRDDPVFLTIWKQETEGLFPGQAYFNTFPEEYFAETFAMYFLGGKTKKLLKEEAPKTFEFFLLLQ